jgi:hypothetical protein
MDVPNKVVKKRVDDLDESEKELLAVAIGCAKVLNSLSSSPKIKEELRKHGVIFLFARFLKCKITELIVPMMGAVQQCSNLVSGNIYYLLFCAQCASLDERLFYYLHRRCNKYALNEYKTFRLSIIHILSS